MIRKIILSLVVFAVYLFLGRDSFATHTPDELRAICGTMEVAAYMSSTSPGAWKSGAISVSCPGTGSLACNSSHGVVNGSISPGSSNAILTACDCSATGGACLNVEGQQVTAAGSFSKTLSNGCTLTKVNSSSSAACISNGSYNYYSIEVSCPAPATPCPKGADIVLALMERVLLLAQEGKQIPIVGWIRKVIRIGVRQMPVEVKATVLMHVNLQRLQHQRQRHLQPLQPHQACQLCHLLQHLRPHQLHLLAYLRQLPLRECLQQPRHLLLRLRFLLAETLVPANLIVLAQRTDVSSVFPMQRVKKFVQKHPPAVRHARVKQHVTAQRMGALNAFPMPQVKRSVQNLLHVEQRVRQRLNVTVQRTDA